MAVTQPNLTIGLTVDSGCSELNLTDDTGQYDAITNPYGYGLVGGPDEADITGCEIVVTYNTLGTYTTFDFTIASGVITAATLAVGSATPTNILAELDSTAWPFITDVNPLNLVGEYGVTIPEFTDEIFKVTYNITGEIAGPEAFDFTTTAYEPVVCNSRCCVDRKFQEIDVNCACSDDKITEALYGETLIKQVEIASEQGDSTAALQALEQLRLLCGSEGGCGC
jgi:hypothetical protein